jgi:hypothetical protein
MKFHLNLADSGTTFSQHQNSERDWLANLPSGWPFCFM